MRILQWCSTVVVNDSASSKMRAFSRENEKEEEEERKHSGAQDSRSVLEKYRILKVLKKNIQIPRRSEIASVSRPHLEPRPRNLLSPRLFVCKNFLTFWRIHNNKSYLFFSVLFIGWVVKRLNLLWFRSTMFELLCIEFSFTVKLSIPSSESTAERRHTYYVRFNTPFLHFVYSIAHIVISGLGELLKFK